MPTITFLQNSREDLSIEVKEGTKITQAAYAAGIKIEQTCGGTPSCTDCTIKVIKEEHGGSLEPMQGDEKRLLGNVYHITHERLACQSVIKNSLTVEVPLLEVKKREERE